MLSLFTIILQHFKELLKNSFTQLPNSDITPVRTRLFVHHKIKYTYLADTERLKQYVKVTNTIKFTHIKPYKKARCIPLRNVTLLTFVNLYKQCHVGHYIHTPQYPQVLLFNHILQLFPIHSTAPDDAAQKLISEYM